jgi:hypothetical protein
MRSAKIKKVTQNLRLENDKDKVTVKVGTYKKKFLETKN